MDLTSVNSVEEVCPLLLFLDVCIDEQGVCFGMDVLHHDLKSVEAASFGYLHLPTESLDKILIDDPVGSGEEGKDMGDEVALVIIQSIVPVMEILGQINLLGSPEGCFGLLVHLPDLGEY